MKIDMIVNQPVVETKRLLLRPLRRSDAGNMELFVADERVARMTRSIPHPLPPGAVDSIIGAALAEDRVEDIWVLDGSSTGLGEFLGLITLEQMDRNQSEVVYWVVPAFWNAGLASEAVSALIAENPHQDKTIFGSVFQDNPASARVLTNVGFEYLGDAEAYSVARAAPVPTWTYLKRLE
ncbi:MAG: GNAT family N-acetyltransferase [Boseongicola sp.]|nr:MAG: GNAT family N-acetyltransferase [Boseongicola sp.]